MRDNNNTTRTKHTYRKKLTNYELPTILFVFPLIFTFLLYLYMLTYTSIKEFASFFFSCVLCCVCSFSRFRASHFFNVLYVYFHRLTLRQSFMQMKYTTKSHEFVFVCIVCIFVYICLNVSFCSRSL